MNEITSVQIPEEIDKSFEILAKETHMPKVFHFEKALKNYLKQFNKLNSEIFQFDDKSETDLEKIDVTVQTKYSYKAQLQKVKEKNERKKILNSPFFSSSPANLGYTEASLLDKIIAGDE